MEFKRKEIVMSKQNIQDLDQLFMEQFEILTEEALLNVSGGSWEGFLEGLNGVFGTIATALEPDY
ncbi:MAG: hypothetical protein LBI43_02645 [Streptococcaceae bacterium]|jgi:hypothetical protein|nr:hypothetical protein [Streptococcaceae bacterium]